MKKQLTAESNLTLKNYKEPLIKVKNGYGYYGAILQTKDGSKVQCHCCGKLYKHLGAHAKQAHDLGADDYKEKYKLSLSTALVSEELRWELKNRSLKYFKSLTEEEKAEYREYAKQGAKKRARLVREGKINQPKERLEAKNKKGTCPDQLLAKIKEVADKLKKTPSKQEFIWECGTQRYVHLIYKTFGSWSKALKMLNMTPRTGHGHKNGGPQYNDDELLEYLVIFAQENNQVPTYTDFRRGLLPSYETYIRRFGSISEARRLANIVDHLEIERMSEEQ